MAYLHTTSLSVGPSPKSPAVVFGRESFVGKSSRGSRRRILIRRACQSDLRQNLRLLYLDERVLWENRRVVGDGVFSYVEPSNRRFSPKISVQIRAACRCMPVFHRQRTISVRLRNHLPRRRGIRQDLQGLRDYPICRRESLR